MYGGDYKVKTSIAEEFMWQRITLIIDNAIEMPVPSLV